MDGFVSWTIPFKKNKMRTIGLPLWLRKLPHGGKMTHWFPWWLSCTYGLDHRSPRGAKRDTFHGGALSMTRALQLVPRHHSNDHLDESDQLIEFGGFILIHQSDQPGVFYHPGLEDDENHIEGSIWVNHNWIRDQWLSLIEWSLTTMIPS